MTRGIITPSMDALATAMKRRAETGIFNGQNVESRYFQNAKRIHDATGTVLIYTRDVGYHTSGWFKNPDYERCYQLSGSFHDPKTMDFVPFDSTLAALWVKTFYHEWTRFVWDESNATLPTKTSGEIHHYRVFCDPAWQPIVPRGEVYTRDFIENGWKSFSDQQYDKYLTESLTP